MGFQLAVESLLFTLYKTIQERVKCLGVVVVAGVA